MVPLGTPTNSLSNPVAPVAASSPSVLNVIRKGTVRPNKTNSKWLHVKQKDRKKERQKDRKTSECLLIWKKLNNKVSAQKDLK